MSYNRKDDRITDYEIQKIVFIHKGFALYYIKTLSPLFRSQSPFIVVPPSSEYGIIAPKVFGDLLESLAGAVFLDCGLDLVTVWQVFYPIMKKTIGI